MRTRQVLSIAFVVIVSGLILYASWRRDSPNQFEAPFQAGGDVTLDLSTGGYTIQGTTEDKIRVEVDPIDQAVTRSQISVSGNRAKVMVEGPTDGFQATVYVPQRTDLTVFQTIGDLRVQGIEGNKNLGLNIGKISVDVVDPAKVKSVSALVKIGNVHAGPWHLGRGGFFRSFHAGGQGPYRLKADLDIGDIELRD